MVPTLTLLSGISMPVLGLGTWNLKDEEGKSAILSALKMGYRHIDTADMYKNHTIIGKGIEESGVAREDLFIVSKVWPTDLYTDDLTYVFKKALSDLGIDYIDLFLIHHPPRENLELIMRALETLARFKDDGRVRAIGVSNFEKEHIDIARKTGVEVANNQIQLSISHWTPDIVQYCRENNIAVTAYSPLGEGSDLSLDIVDEIADEAHATPPQVSLAWLLSKGVAVIPKSGNPDHQQENLNAINIALTKEQINRLDEYALREVK